MKTRAFLMLWAALLLYGPSIAASPADSTQTKPAAAASPAIPNVIKVCDVYKKGHPDPKDAKRNRAGLGDIIVVKISGFQELLKKANPAGGTPKNIKLFLDGREIDGILPISAAPQQDVGELQFQLIRSQANDPMWTTLLGKPSIKYLFLKQVKVSVGIEGTYAENSLIDKFDIIRIDEFWFWLCVGGVVFYLILLVSFRKSPMLRDAGTDLSSLGIPPVINRPYSLGRVQMAIWFSVVLISFLFIWLITNNHDLITGGILGLIGISAVTALGAVSIDTGKGQETIKAIQELQQQAGVLASEISALQQITPPNPANDELIRIKQKSLAQANAAIAQKIASLQVSSSGFWNDILTDVNGVSFHRLQMFIWTFVLLIVFFYSVWASFVMPDFSANMLALQGITAGTYLGFKFPEKQA